MKNLFKSLSKTLLVTAVASIASVSMANGLPFTVQEGSVPGTTANAVTATRINFDHKETITSGGLAALGGTGLFTESGFLTFTGFLNDGVTQDTFINGPGVTGYKLYGLFNFNGTITTDGTGGLLYNPVSPASISLYLDPNSNTTLTLPGSGSGAVIRGSIGDDVLLGTATDLKSAQGHIFPGLANGDFEGIFSDWLLTPAGSAYFVNPNPFHMIIDFNGNLTQVSNGSPLPFTGTINGSGNAFFAAPTPGVVVLFGMGLAALGFSRRKQ